MKKNPLRRTLAIREILNVGSIHPGGVYFTSSDGGAQFCMFAFGSQSGKLEGKILSELGCEPGDKVECFISFTKMSKKSEKGGGL